MEEASNLHSKRKYMLKPRYANQSTVKRKTIVAIALCPSVCLSVSYKHIHIHSHSHILKTIYKSKKLVCLGKN